MTLPLTPSVQSPTAWDRQHLTRSGMRTRLSDDGYRYAIHPAETDAGLVDADLVFGFDVGDVRRYGAVGDGVTNDTTALQVVSDVINAMGGGTVTFERAASYLVWVGSSPNLLDFANCVGVHVEGNGATLVSGRTNGPGVFAINFDTCAQCSVRNLSLTGSNTTLTHTTGEGLLNIGAACRQIHLENLYSLNCQVLVQCGDGSTPPLSNRTAGITFKNLSAENTYYGFACSGNGDSVRGSIKGVNTGRVYFVWNVRNHEVQIDGQQQGPFSDVLIKAYAYSSGYSACEHIKVRYYTDGKSADAEVNTAPDAMVHLEVQLVDVTGARLDNIDVEVDIDCTNNGSKINRIFGIDKRDTNGDLDTTGTRGHVVSNIRLHGIVKGFQNSGAHTNSVEPVMIFNNSSSSDWSGEVAQNIEIGPFVIEDTTSSPSIFGIFVNGAPFVSGRPTINVHDVNISNLKYGRVNWSAGFKYVEDSIKANSAYTPMISYTPTWTGASSNPAIGNGTLTGHYVRRGNEVTAMVSLAAGSTTTFGSGVWYFSLPTTPVSTHKTHGHGYALVAGSTRYPVAVETLADGTARVQLVAHQGSGFITSGVPGTWASGDNLQFTIRYFEN